MLTLNRVRIAVAVTLSGLTAATWFAAVVTGAAGLFPAAIMLGAAAAYRWNRVA